MEKNTSLLPSHDEIMKMFPIDPSQIVNISDHRDIKEMNRRMKAKTCQPFRNELYSINPNFNGIYTDNGRLTKRGKPMKGYYMGNIIH